MATTTTQHRTLTIREAAAVLGLSPGTVRQHVKAGRIAAARRQGKFGEEYAIRPAVLTAFAAEHLGRQVEIPDEAEVSLPLLAPDVRDLYERLITATEEATRYKAIASVSESTQQEMRERIGELEAELAALRARGFWKRLFKPAG